MKKLLITLCLALSTQLSFAQEEMLEEVFHSGEATQKASEAMGQEMMATLMAAATAKEGKQPSEEEMASIMFDSMKKHSVALKSGMQTDCATENDAAACACFYEKVELENFFDDMKAAVLSAKSEEDAKKKMQPMIDDLKVKKAECKLQ